MDLFVKLYDGKLYDEDQSFADLLKVALAGLQFLMI